MELIQMPNNKFIIRAHGEMIDYVDGMINHIELMKALNDFLETGNNIAHFGIIKGEFMFTDRITT